MTTIAPEKTGLQHDLDIFHEMMDFEAEPADPNHKAHIVNPPMNMHIWQEGMEAQDVVDIARISGTIVVALCGYKFVPKHNPEKLDACDACMEIAGQIIREES